MDSQILDLISYCRLPPPKKTEKIVQNQLPYKEWLGGIFPCLLLVYGFVYQCLMKKLRVMT